MKYLLALFLLPAFAPAAILPDTIGPYHRTATLPVTLQDKAVWDDYGLKESEAAAYENEKSRFTVTAWRLSDTTGSMAAFDWQRPPQATPSKLAPLAAETTDSALLVHGNYLFQFVGRKPEPAELSAIADTLKNVDGTLLPSLPDYLPSQGRIPNSERYVTGPASLARFSPGVPPSVAAFRFGSEAALSVYRTPKGETALVVFNYPTHPIAREREADFVKVPGAVVKRSGPLVAVVLNPPDPDAAERLLAQVRYQASVTLNEYVPTKRDNIGNLVVNAFVLIGLLLAFAVVSGLALGGLRAFQKHGRKGEDEDGLVTLHLNR